MKRKKHDASNPSLRLPSDVTEAVGKIVSATGWSGSAALALLARAGSNVVSGKGEKIAGFKALLNAAIDHCEAEIAAKKKLALTASKLREARKLVEK